MYKNIYCILIKLLNRLELFKTNNEVASFLEQEKI